MKLFAALVMFAQIKFDWNISLGTIIHLFGMVVCVVGLYVKLNDRLSALETKVDIIFAWWTKKMGTTE
jgi:hypothetical protein